MSTLVLADRAPVVRDGLRALLASHDDIHVVAEAATSRDTLFETLRWRPDVLLLDFDRTDLISTCREIRRSAPDTGVLVFSDCDDDSTVLATIRTGVLGYVPKSAPESDLVRAIHNVAAGQAVFGKHVAGKITELLHTQPPEAFPDLTRREREILHLLVVGMPVPAIANRLALASKTVRNHTSGIFHKLGVASRDEAVVLARRAGLDRLVRQ
ncbi:hypothetical protein ALI144C_21910 [Actinosynnema sp. ALI-1.44]|uniref:LuxR C-terminal-related transcriptional regulator n=1 Tax=Actinosynnema sp. ALI-1.44 TaxID=1933779 RepID=UPI00097BCAD0|nr:response regulator transcription factor [Actinosynnema sp. ALI-1.44]ONI81197.1 hypothetical protein ALI144C_21910 [Actinosynnema sp. ALI-1.44]